MEQADRQQLALLPPRIVTVGTLPELLYQQKRPFASRLVQQLAWAQALRTSGRSTIKKIAPSMPPQPDESRWFELGGLLQRQHRELAGHRLDFAGVAQKGQQVRGFADAARWKALAKVQADYLSILTGSSSGTSKRRATLPSTTENATSMEK